MPVMSTRLSVVVRTLPLATCRGFMTNFGGAPQRTACHPMSGNVELKQPSIAGASCLSVVSHADIASARPVLFIAATCAAAPALTMLPTMQAPSMYFDLNFLMVFLLV
ncbi:hypothetical protein CEX93_14460 [Xanthomonas euvesicatoria]|nr:hypothetical protein CEX93_14460 [Xanthomonas euvesicatoria]